MKKILYLTKYELRRIRKSAILTAIVLAIFLGALFGVISVQTDMMDNMCAHLDKEYPGEVDLSASNATYNDISDFVDGLVMDGWSMDGINGADIICPDGTAYKVVEQITEGPFAGAYRVVDGETVFPNDAMKNLLNQYDDCIVEGRWVSNPFEMCVDTFLYAELNVQIGDILQKDGYSFTLVGVYDYEIFVAKGGELDAHHIMTVDGSTPTVQWNWNFATAKQAFEAYRQLQRRGVEVYIGWWFEGYYSDITQMRTVFTAVDAVLVIVILLVLYSLVSVLFRQRKTQICRLRILGASDRLVAGVYCGMVLLLMLAVVLIATALGVAFNYYFMDLCAEMLEYEFVSHFVVFLPFVAFAVFGAVTFLIWVAINRRTKNNLATEIRYE